MKQILQSLKNGRTTILDIPMPQVKPGHVLIETRQSLISPGTEKMLVTFGEASLLKKARQQPDKMRMVINKIKTDGLLSTLDRIRQQLDQLIPMGYSNVGNVIALGPDVSEFCIGDRVVSNGAHAEIVSVPKNLCCRVPEGISNDEAAFTVLGAIALQGIRLSEPAMGETFAVIGLGLIGLLTVLLLRANGCRVLGIDIDAEKTKLASALGIETITLHRHANADDQLKMVSASAQSFSRKHGMDGVIITCSTEKNDPILQAANMCRKRGRITLVGVTGLQLSRTLFYEKELRFQVSCAYGPGRYDQNYEQLGQDYPLAFVRFTAQRNFQAFLDVLTQKMINVQPLITHRYSLENAELAYDALRDPSKHFVAIMLDYPNNNYKDKNKNKLYARTVYHSQKQSVFRPQEKIAIGLIGAGNYATRVLIPAFKKAHAGCKMIACVNGLSGMHAAKRFNIESVTTDPDQLILHDDINTVVIATRHNHHAEFVVRALEQSKHVFVEKPLCLTQTELAKIAQAAKNSSSLLMVGFNRRFAPQIQKIKSCITSRQQPLSMIITVNAGDLPRNHWVQDIAIGGGRILSEVCHFIDLLRYLVGVKITDYQLTQMKNTDINHDKVSITLSFADGSFGVIHYFANGHESFPKERLEIFTDGRILQLNNFRKLRAFGFPQFKRMHLWRQDKGQETCVSAFLHAISHHLPSPIPLEEILEVAEVTIDIAETSKLS